jgi:hypothetical protein
MQLEIAGIMVGESRDAQIALLQANGYSFPRAQDAFWVMQEEEESANASDEFDLTEEKKSGDAADVKLEASSESQPAAAPVTPAQVALTFRNDSGLETPYSLKSHKPMEKYFADFIKRSGRPLTFTYKGQELKGDESPKEWKMMDGDVVLGSAPKKKRSYQHAGGMAAATAAAAASAVSNEAASPASSSDASPADGPLFKRAKSDPSIPAAAAPAAAANIIIAAPPVYRAPWKTLLLGYVPFTLRQPLGVIDPIKGTLSRAPSSHSTLASFLADLKLNQWTPDLPDPPQPDGMADSPEEQERLLAKYRAERDGNFAKNMRVVEVLKSWSNKHHAVDCFIRCISSETECPQCKRAGCACSQRRVRHSFHASISLLAGAHSEHIPSANWLFSLLHDGFREIVDLKLNQGERKLGALSLGAALELSVRTKFTRPSERSRYGGGGGGAGEEIEDAKDDFLMDGEYPSAMDDDAAPAPMPAAKKGRSRGRKAAASSESGEEDVDMVNGGAASSSGAAASSVPLSENARVRSDLGMPLDWEDDLTGPRGGSIARDDAGEAVAGVPAQAVAA